MKHRHALQIHARVYRYGFVAVLWKAIEGWLLAWGYPESHEGRP